MRTMHSQQSEEPLTFCCPMLSQTAALAILHSKAIKVHPTVKAISFHA